MATGSKLRGIIIYNMHTNLWDINFLRTSWGIEYVRYDIATFNPIEFGAKPDDATAQQRTTAYTAWMLSQLTYLDLVLAKCAAFNVQLIVHIGTPPGGSTVAAGDVIPPGGSNYTRIFLEQWALDLFINIWEYIARYYKGDSRIWGFDLIAEPGFPRGKIALLVERTIKWPKLAEKLVRRINAIDPTRRIIVSPKNGNCNEFDGLHNLTQTLQSFPVRYSCNMYGIGGHFDRQGAVSPYSETNVYPNTAHAPPFNKAYLRRALSPAVEFQQLIQHPLLITAFSCVRWAPKGSAYRFLRDLISLFEENRWGWFYEGYVAPNPGIPMGGTPFSLEYDETYNPDPFYHPKPIYPPAESPRLTLMKTAWAGLPLP